MASDHGLGLPPESSRLIVTGQIGCGKSTYASQVARKLDATQVDLDQFNGVPDAHAAATRLINGIRGPWVVDGCVWQVPVAMWSAADAVIHLDYANRVHYSRIARRALKRCFQEPRWSAMRAVLLEEREHIRIMYRYADANRSGWSAAGGITDVDVPVIICSTPSSASELLQSISA